MSEAALFATVIRRVLDQFKTLLITSRCHKAQRRRDLEVLTNTRSGVFEWLATSCEPCRMLQVSVGSLSAHQSQSVEMLDCTEERRRRIRAEM